MSSLVYICHYSFRFIFESDNAPTKAKIPSFIWARKDLSIGAGSKAWLKYISVSAETVAVYGLCFYGLSALHSCGWLKGAASQM